jgi:putative hydrolase of the HAD superfamily
MTSIVVLDLDDTLFLEREYVYSGFTAVGALLASEHGLDGFVECAWRHFGNGLRGRVFDIALAELGLSPSPQLIRKLVDVYRTHEPTIRMAADARQFLERAKLAQIPIAIVSDGYQVAQLAKIRALELTKFASPIILTDVYGREGWKPSTRGFLEVFRVIGGDPQGYVYIGDNPTKDFTAPNALGWRTVRIRRPLGEHSHVATAIAGGGAHEEIESFSSLHIIEDRIVRAKRSARVGC